MNMQVLDARRDASGGYKVDELVTVARWQSDRFRETRPSAPLPLNGALWWEAGEPTASVTAVKIANLPATTVSNRRRLTQIWSEKQFDLAKWWLVTVACSDREACQKRTQAARGSTKPMVDRDVDFNRTEIAVASAP